MAQFIVSVGITGILLAIGAMGVFKVYKTTHLEEMKLSLRRTVTAFERQLRNDLSTIIRSTDYSGSAIPGIASALSEAPDADLMRDQIVFLRSAFSEHSRPVLVSGSEVQFLYPVAQAEDPATEFMISAIQNRQFFSLTSPTGVSLVRKLSVETATASDPTLAQLNFDLANTDAFDATRYNRLVKLAPAEAVRYFVDSDGVVRQTEGSERRLVAPGATGLQFKFGFSQRADSATPLCLPSGLIRHIKDPAYLAACPDPATRVTWNDANRVQVQLKLVHSSPVVDQDRAELADGFSIENGKLKYTAQFNSPLYDVSYQDVIQTGESMACSELFENNRCKPGCEAYFDSHDPNALDSKRYKYGSDHCLCMQGLRPTNSTDYMDPVAYLDGRLTNGNRPGFTSMTATQKAAMPYCARDMGVCDGPTGQGSPVWRWWALVYPQAAFACRCGGGLEAFDTSESTWNQAAQERVEARMLAIRNASAEPLNSRVAALTPLVNCDSALNGYGNETCGNLVNVMTGGGYHSYADACGCKSPNTHGFSQAISYGRVCNLPPPAGWEVPTCPNSMTVETNGARTYKLKTTTEPANGLSEGVTPIVAAICECAYLYNSSSNNRPSVNGVVYPPLDSTFTNYNLVELDVRVRREAVPGSYQGDPPMPSNGLIPCTNFPAPSTYGATGSLTTLVTTQLGTDTPETTAVSCGAVMAAARYHALSNCIVNEHGLNPTDLLSNYLQPRCSSYGDQPGNAINSEIRVMRQLAGNRNATITCPNSTTNPPASCPNPPCNQSGTDGDESL